MMALHLHGSSNPLGITGNLDRLPMHGYFIFKDLITVFVFLIVFFLFVFLSPNTLGQIMALLIIINIIINMYCAVCWKSSFLNNYLWIIYNKTQYYINNNMNIISDLLNPDRVKYYYKEGNQQVTNINTSSGPSTEGAGINIFINEQSMKEDYLLVGTSETTRTHKNKFYSLFSIKRHYSTLSSNNYKILEYNNNIKFNQWLAGLIDGDGYFGITKNKYASCEILVELRDEKMLRQIQNKFGGSIKLRSGVKAIRYRLSDKQGIINLINAVNGNIRNTKRLVQFNKVCNLLNIKFKEPIKLNKDNAWFIGFFDADGTINYYYRDKNDKLKIRPQLTISVTNKYLYDIEYYRNVFGGNIYFDKGQNGYFKWSINNKELHNIFYNYNKNYPSKSYKGKRLFLINKFYYLYDLLAFRTSDNTALYKAWLKFDEKWNYNK